MKISEQEILLEDVVICNDNIYTDLTNSQDLFEKKCHNFYHTKLKSELPLHFETVEINQKVIAHWLGHAGGNIGHYFNEHFYSAIVSYLFDKNCSIFLNSQSPLYHSEDVFNFKNKIGGGFCWGASLLNCMDIPTIRYKPNIIFKIAQLVLPRVDRSISQDNIYGVDPLMYIKNKVLNFISPKKEPFDVLFFAKKNDRNIINQQEVLEFLFKIKKSVKVIEDFRDHSFREVVYLIANANTFVAPWGSHLTNVLFMSPNSFVYELHPSNMRDHWWNVMGNNFKKRCSINYTNIPCKSVECEDKKRENTKIVVNIPDIWN